MADFPGNFGTILNANQYWRNKTNTHFIFAGDNISGMPTGVPQGPRTENEGVHFYAGRFDLPEG